MSNFKLKLRQASLPLLVPVCWAGCSRRILMLREECHRGQGGQTLRGSGDDTKAKANARQRRREARA